MRSPASEKLEIISPIEGSHLPIKQTRYMLGISRTTFYRWYDRYVDGVFDALADESPRPKSVWNRIPDGRRDDLIEFALGHEALSTQELAVKYTDEKRYFVSECPPSYKMRPQWHPQGRPVVPLKGLEPPTPSLRMTCSTI